MLKGCRAAGPDQQNRHHVDICRIEMLQFHNPYSLVRTPQRPGDNHWRRRRTPGPVQLDRTFDQFCPAL